MVSGVNMCQESRSQRSLWSPRSRVGWHDVAQMGQTPVTPGQWRHWALVTGHRGGADDHRHALCHNFFVCFVLMLRPFTGWLTSRSSPIIAVGTDIFCCHWSDSAPSEILNFCLLRSHSSIIPAVITSEIHQCISFLDYQTSQVLQFWCDSNGVKSYRYQMRWV